MFAVIRAVRVSTGVLLLALAGCATGPDAERFSSPNWEAQAQRPVVALPEETPPVPVPPPAPVSNSVQTATVTNEFQGNWIALDQWCESKGIERSRRTRATPSPAYAVSTTNGTFVLGVGTQSAYWSGLEVRLGYAPRLADGRILVHSLDLQRTLQPLLTAAPLGSFSGNPVIVIDPGHGGEDSGAKSVLGGRCEKDYTLDWASRIAYVLSTNGWIVHLTRTNDVAVPLTNRVAFAEDRGASLFLSLHFNSAAPDTTQAGIETYCLTPAGMPSTLTRGFADDPRLAFPNNAFDVQNLQFAIRVHRSMLRLAGSQDRGVRRARFLSVLRGQRRPAILVEGGFLSNPREARLIANPAYRQKLAENLAGALLIPRGSAGLPALVQASSNHGSAGGAPSLEPGVPLSSAPEVLGKSLP